MPDLVAAETSEKRLLLAKVDDPHIHFLARDGVNMGRLHVANLLQRSDLLHGIGIGMIAGGITGALAGMVLSFYLQLGQSIGVGGIQVLAVVGAVIGAWVSGMIAVSIPNSRLRRFQPAIDRGEILLMADVPVRRVREIRELIMSHHPEVLARGLEAQIPALLNGVPHNASNWTAASAAVFDSLFSAALGVVAPASARPAVARHGVPTCTSGPLRSDIRWWPGPRHCAGRSRC